MSATVLPMQTDVGDETLPVGNATGAASTPFARETVTLSKQAHIELVMAARQYKSLHQRATARARWTERRHHHEMGWRAFDLVG